MMPSSCSGIGFYVSLYWRDKTGLAGGTEDSLPGAVDVGIWPKEWSVVCCPSCQGAAWAAGAGVRHLQHGQLVSLPAQCSALAAPCPAEATARATGHRWSQAQSLVSSTVGVSVTQEPAQSRTGAWLGVGHSASPDQWGGAGDGAGRASLQHRPAGLRAQAQGWPRVTGPGCPGHLGVLVHPAGSDQNFCRVRKQPILLRCSAFIARTQNNVNTCCFLQVFIQIVIGF